MLLRWIARTYEVDADYRAAEDCAIAAVATAELGEERFGLRREYFRVHAGNKYARIEDDRGHDASSRTSSSNESVPMVASEPRRFPIWDCNPSTAAHHAT